MSIKKISTKYRCSKCGEISQAQPPKEDDVQSFLIKCLGCKHQTTIYLGATYTSSTSHYITGRELTNLIEF